MRLIKKDLLDNDSGLILHGVNCQRKMNSGVAKAIRNKWPIVYEKYYNNGRGAHLLGTFQPIVISESLVIGNCYTQEFYGRSLGPFASLDAICVSLTSAAMFSKECKLELKMPKIGAGLGGLPWNEVAEVIDNVEKNLNVVFNIHYID